MVGLLKCGINVWRVMNVTSLCATRSRNPAPDTFIGLTVSRLRWSAPELPGRPELGVHLGGEPLCDGHLCVADFGVRLGNLGVEISPGLRRNDVGLALAFLDHFRDTIRTPNLHFRFVKKAFRSTVGPLPRM